MLKYPVRLSAKAYWRSSHNFIRKTARCRGQNLQCEQHSHATAEQPACFLGSKSPELLTLYFQEDDVSGSWSSVKLCSTKYPEGELITSIPGVRQMRGGKRRRSPPPPGRRGEDRRMGGGAPYPPQGYRDRRPRSTSPEPRYRRSPPPYNKRYRREDDAYDRL